MGTTLTGTTPQDTYDSLIKVTDNGPLTGSLKKLTDGLGNDSSLSLSTTAASLSGTLAVTGNATFDTNTLFVDAASNEVGIGTITPNAVLNVIGEISQADFGTSTNSIFSQRSSGSIFTITTTGTTAAQGTEINYSWANGGQGPLKFSRAGAEVMRLDPSGNVGIGTSAPTGSYGKLTVAGTGITINADGSAKLEIGRYSAGASNSYIKLGSTSTSLRFTNAADTTDIVVIENNTTGEKLRVLESGGITFNGDTAAANALDDYEEGTWTMGVSFGGASVGQTASNFAGSYTKVGRQVTVNGLLTLTSKGSSTGAALITGLPFTIANSTSNYAAVSIWFNNVSFLGQFSSLGIVASTTLQLWDISSLGVITAITNSNFANDSEVMVNFTYFV